MSPLRATLWVVRRVESVGVVVAPTRSDAVPYSTLDVAASSVAHWTVAVRVEPGIAVRLEMTGAVVSGGGAPYHTA